LISDSSVPVEHREAQQASFMEANLSELLILRVMAFYSRYTTFL